MSPSVVVRDNVIIDGLLQDSMRIFGGGLPNEGSPPSPDASFRGRNDFAARSPMKALTALLDRDAVRLRTLTGPGGVGKTRLALQVAQTLHAQGHYADGVLFADLAALRDAELVLPMVARLLGVPESPTQPPRERLPAALRHRQLLLLLDNCEHLPAVAPPLTELLVQCPRLTILAAIPPSRSTSRQAW